MGPSQPSCLNPLLSPRGRWQAWCLRVIGVVPGPLRGRDSKGSSSLPQDTGAVGTRSLYPAALGQDVWLTPHSWVALQTLPSRMTWGLGDP